MEPAAEDTSFWWKACMCKPGTWERHVMPPFAMADLRVCWGRVFFFLGDCFLIVKLLRADPISETRSELESSSLWVPSQVLTNPGIYKLSRQWNTVETLVTLCHRSPSLSEMTLTQKEPSTHWKLGRLGLDHTAKLLLYWLGLLVCFSTWKDLGTAMPCSLVCPQQSGCFGKRCQMGIILASSTDICAGIK